MRWLVPLSVVPVLALLAYGFTTDPRDIPSPLVGRPASAFTLTTFDGAPVTLAALRGKVVVLNFWASWCNPACYDEARRRVASALKRCADDVVAPVADGRA